MLKKKFLTTLNILAFLVKRAGHTTHLNKDALRKIINEKSRQKTQIL